MGQYNLSIPFGQFQPGVGWLNKFILSHEEFERNLYPGMSWIDVVNCRS